MKAALEEAKKALSDGEVPIGAVLVRDGAIIARGYNSPILLQDPTAHAEVITLRRGGRVLGNYRLTDTELYVTLEPCIMCMGALLHARIKRLVFGTRDPRAGAAGSVVDFSCHESMNHRIKVTGGILEEECRNLLQRFFKTKR